MLLDQAIQIISTEHCSGMRILYDDTAAMLEKDCKDAQRLCDELIIEGQSVVYGPGGIGKTALLKRLAQLARERQVAVAFFDAHVRVEDYRTRLASRK